MNDIRKRGLGRGLDALFRDMKKEDPLSAPASSIDSAPIKRVDEAAPPIKRADELVSAAKTVQPVPTPVVSIPTSAPAPTLVSGARKIAVDKLKPGEFQPRTVFEPEALEQLAESIKVHGIIQPLIVRPVKDGMFEIIAGERRWRAAQKAKLHELPVVVRDLTDQESFEIALIENLQRSDLSAIEEAEGYQRLMEEFAHTQEDLSKRLGKSRSHVANTLRLLNLHPAVRQKLAEGKITAGHARAMLGAKDPAAILSAVVSRGLSVRDTEKLVGRSAEGKAKVAGKKKATFLQKDVDILALESKLTSKIGMRVTISGSGPKGQLIIDYKSLEQLDYLLKCFSK